MGSALLCGQQGERKMGSSALPPACRTHGNCSLFVCCSSFSPCLSWMRFPVPCCPSGSQLRDVVHNARCKPIRVWGIGMTAVFELFAWAREGRTNPVHSDSPANISHSSSCQPLVTIAPAPPGSLPFTRLCFSSRI